MGKGKGRKYDRGEVKMKIPVYLKNNVKNYEEKDFAIMTICSQTGNDLLEVWYYGDFFMVSGEERNYIVGTDFAPEKIVAKDPETNEEILIFDGTVHGYDNMFCDVYTEEQINDRELKKLDIPILGKHDALNDALMTAMIFLKLAYLPSNKSDFFYN